MTRVYGGSRVFRLRHVQLIGHALHWDDERIYRRARQHKRGEIEGFSSKYHCDRLVYYESFDDVRKAIGREKQLKGWTRAKKIALIESKNARWEDMAEKWGSEMLFAGEPLKKVSS